MTPGHMAITSLIYTYAERIDLGNFEGVAELFSDATVTVEGTDTQMSGTAPVLGMYQATTRLYPDNGTPHTKHVTTNLIVEVDEDAGTGTCRSYFTVFQGVDDFPLQPVIAGRYHDRFERADGVWRFSHRHMFCDLFGDLSRHMLIPIGPGGELPTL